MIEKTYRMLAKKVLEKYKETWKLLKKEEEFLFKRFREKNDYLAQKKSKLIDFNWKDRCKCISCDKIMYRSEANWCHRIDKWRSGNYWCRWEERNIRAWCTDCNNYNKERHKSNYTLYMIKRYWIDRVEKQLYQERQINKRPHRTELMETRKKLNERYKENNQKV
jgi:hypothetical protein